MEPPYVLQDSPWQLDVTESRRCTSPRGGSSGGPSSPRTGFVRRTGRAGNLIGLYLRRVEPPGRGRHLLDGLVEFHLGAALEPDRVDPRDDERAEVRTLEAARLQSLHCLTHR